MGDSNPRGLLALHDPDFCGRDGAAYAPAGGKEAGRDAPYFHILTFSCQMN